MSLLDLMRWEDDGGSPEPPPSVTVVLPASLAADAADAIDDLGNDASLALKRLWGYLDAACSINAIKNKEK